MVFWRVQHEKVKEEMNNKKSKVGGAKGGFERKTPSGYLCVYV
jgi:hypothetical protein